MQYSYEITPRPIELGGGVFPPVEGIEDVAAALQAAFDDAEGEAYAWLDSKEA